MLSARNAGYAACGCSISALFICLYYVPTLVVKIQNINEQLKVDSDDFKVMADMTWNELTKTRMSSSTGRFRRQYDTYGAAPKKTYPLHNAYVKEDAFVESSGQCSCNGNNNCPSGPPVEFSNIQKEELGNAGRPGLDGEPGKPGEPGAPGLAGVAPPVTIEPWPTRTSLESKVVKDTLDSQVPQENSERREAKAEMESEKGGDGPKGPVGFPGRDGARGQDGEIGPAGPTVLLVPMEIIANVLVNIDCCLNQIYIPITERSSLGVNKYPETKYDSGVSNEAPGYQPKPPSYQDQAVSKPDNNPYSKKKA
ncbi:hypothetical protein WR25_02391 [Diploscapter pachys]|uniref:Nematode cuticle collagen N-terminal domain-containing protein n=1 Tax=Diploscapter pachys TaxID=2018661 RepID=A0A2A2LM94_9BILA|nr:hypothetical protein WR25_02391 [Diploscapter pachys]